MPENSASGRMPGRNGDAVFVDEDDGMPLLISPFEAPATRTERQED